MLQLMRPLWILSAPNRSERMAWTASWAASLTPSFAPRHVSFAGTERKQPLMEGIRFLAAGLAAASLVAGVPAADAKVILVQPEVKNFVKDTPKAAPSGEAKAAPTKRAPPPAAETSEGFDFKPLVLPLSLALVGAGGFALASVDPGFAEMMVEAGAKDSRSYAGYETGLKDTPFFGGSGSIPTSVPGGASSKAATSKTKKKGFF
jgi:hypothetical protein